MSNPPDINSDCVLSLIELLWSFFLLLLFFHIAFNRFCNYGGRNRQTHLTPITPSSIPIVNGHSPVCLLLFYHILPFIPFLFLKIWRKKCGIYHNTSDTSHTAINSDCLLFHIPEFRLYQNPSETSHTAINFRLSFQDLVFNRTPSYLLFSHILLTFPFLCSSGFVTMKGETDMPELNRTQAPFTYLSGVSGYSAVGKLLRSRALGFCRR